MGKSEVVEFAIGHSATAGTMAKELGSFYCAGIQHQEQLQ
jgi:hypothetical protein